MHLLQIELSSGSALLIHELDHRGVNLARTKADVLRKLLFKLERFLRKSDPAFLIKQRERESYERLLNSYQEEASYYTGREISKEEILEKGREYERQQRHLSNRRTHRCASCGRPLVDHCKLCRNHHHLDGP